MLVLSHNKFKTIDVSQLTQLTKLSLSHNQLQSVPNTKVYLHIIFNPV